ncbi:MAG TPA: hypothetical protein DCM05_00290 [Elusimicrobia bacterium]|nr:hypothetical protein [Elusimicrobiota bacterium]
MLALPLLAIVLAGNAGAIELKFPSTLLKVEDFCEARAFMPAMDRVLHWCENALTITDLASGKELKRFEVPRSYFRAHVLASPDGSRLAVAATPKDDQRVWDLYVFDAESGAALSTEFKFAKTDGSRPEEVEKLLKKVRKSASELREAKSFAIFADSHDPDTFKKPFDAPNGLSIRWTAEAGCDVTASLGAQVLRSSRLEKFRKEPNNVKTEEDMIAMVEAANARHKHERARNACDGLIASQDGRRLVFGQLAYATEVDEKALQHVADTQRAEDHVTKGLDWMRLRSPARALKDFEKAVSLNPRLGEAHMYLGLTHLKLEHAREAAAALKEASALMDKSYAKDIAEVQARAEALAGVQDALKSDQNDTAALRHRILFRISNEDFAGCSVDYRAAKKLKAKLTPIEEEAGTNCVTEATRQAEAEMRAAQEAADAGARESLRKASQYRSSSWWSSVDLAGMARTINAGTNQVGNSASGGSSASGNYRPSGSASASSYSGGSGGTPGASSAARDQALVNQRVEKKLWDMNNPSNRR